MSDIRKLLAEIQRLQDEDADLQEEIKEELELLRAENSDLHDEINRLTSLLKRDRIYH